MNDAPSENWLTHSLLENPWPVAIGLIAIATMLIWLGVRDGLLRRIRAGIAVGAAAVAIIIIGWLVTTAGEHGTQTVRQLAKAAVAGNSAAALQFISPDAVFTVASPKNPGYDAEFIRTQLANLIDRYRVDDNTITMLRGYTESATAAIVELACMTHFSEYPYPAISRWNFRVERNADGDWLITRITCVSINDQTPSVHDLR